MAESFFIAGNKVFYFSTRPLSFRIRTHDGLPYIIIFDDGGSVECDSWITSNYMYSGENMYAKFSFENPGNIREISIAITMMVDFGDNIFPNLEIFSTTSHSFVTGDIADAPVGLTYVHATGQNTLSGDIGNAPVGLTYVYVTGQNTLSGDIGNAPVGLTYVHIQGQNTLSGDIGNAPVGLTYVHIQGQNTLSGDIGNAPVGLTSVRIQGQNTLSGDIADAPVGLTSVHIQGQNTLSYSNKTWVQNQNTHLLRGTILSSEMIDTYLIDLSNVTSWIGSRSVDLRVGGLVKRTSMSDAAVAILQSKGVIVTTN